MSKYASYSDDVVELRIDVFQALFQLALTCLAVLGLSVVIFLDLELALLAPLLLAVATSGGAYWLSHRRRLAIASWLFIAGLLAAPTLLLLLHGPSLAAYMLYMLPIMVSNIVVGGVGLRIATAAALLAFGCTLTQMERPSIFGLYDAARIVAIPLLLYGLVAVISLIEDGIIFTTVQWAIDSHHKDERRARLLLSKQEELDRTILDLSVAHSRLQTLNQELAEARRAAEAASELKTRFLANMSHELRTPLNAILNFTHFIGDPQISQRELNQQQQDFQRRVLCNAEHLLGLINDILDLSKIEAGKVELHPEELQLSTLAEGVMATAVGLTKDKGLELELELPERLPRVWGDKTRVRQIMLNLLSNAAKFTERGTIRVWARERETDMVEIAVRDTGIGIPAAQQGAVFEEFAQVDHPLTRGQQGTGLGLPICKQLVELHGGSMWLESTPGQGSTFFFTLPVAPGPGQHGEPRQGQHDEGPSSERSL